MSSKLNNSIYSNFSEWFLCLCVIFLNDSHFWSDSNTSGWKFSIHFCMLAVQLRMTYHLIQVSIKNMLYTLHATYIEHNLYADFPLRLERLLREFSHDWFFIFFYFFIKCMQSMTMTLSRRCMYAKLHVTWPKLLLYIFSLINHIDSLHIKALLLNSHHRTLVFLCLFALFAFYSFVF